VSDLALIWNDEGFGADVAITAGDLVADDGLKTAVILSLFLDRRARPDDRLPQDGSDRRGWWGDIASTDDDGPIGSRLWLLEREKRLPSVVARAREYCEEALAWLIRDEVARSVTVETEITSEGWLGIGVVIERPEGPARQRFDFVWKGLQ
jgi:phage gp46-like protein